MVFFYYNNNDIEKAIKLFEEAAKLYNSSAYFVLAKINSNNKRYKEARISLEKSAKLDNHRAQYKLGRFFYKGLNDFPIDHKSSYLYFHDSAMKENDKSQFYLGVFFIKEYMYNVI